MPAHLKINATFVCNAAPTYSHCNNLLHAVIRYLPLIVLVCTLAGCGDFLTRLNGYPETDTTINVETATPNEIADALSQLARIAVIGDDWEFLDPNDACTVHVIDKSADESYPLHLQGAAFTLQHDTASQDYYALMQHGDKLVYGQDQTPLRLFETDSYHDVFFAEGYLLALVKKCHQSLGAH